MWIYQEAFIAYHLGYATAGAIALVIVVGIVSAAQFFLLRDDDTSLKSRLGRRR
jgi:ABC-type sugar transport system permease subunit